MSASLRRGALPPAAGDRVPTLRPRDPKAELLGRRGRALVHLHFPPLAAGLSAILLVLGSGVFGAVRLHAMALAFAPLGQGRRGGQSERCQQGDLHGTLLVETNTLRTAPRRRMQTLSPARLFSHRRGPVAACARDRSTIDQPQRVDDAKMFKASFGAGPPEQVLGDVELSRRLSGRGQAFGVAADILGVRSLRHVIETCRILADHRLTSAGRLAVAGQEPRKLVRSSRARTSYEQT